MQGLARFYIMTSIACFLVAACAYLCWHFRGGIYTFFGLGPRVCRIDTGSRDGAVRQIDLYATHADGTMLHVVSSVVWQKEDALNVKRAVDAWLSFLNAERVVLHVGATKEVAILRGNGDVILTFERSFLPNDWPAHSKWCLLSTLGRTLGQLKLGLRRLLLFVDQQPLVDDDLMLECGITLTA